MSSCLNKLYYYYYYYYYRCTLRTTDTADYVLPGTRTKYAERGFCYSGPAALNSLPSDLHDLTDTKTFKNGSRVK